VPTMVYSSDRTAALAEGRNTYQGKPCQRGHSGMRYVSSWYCVDCLAERRL